MLIDIQLQDRGEVLTERRVRLDEADAHRVYDALEALLLTETEAPDVLCDATFGELEQIAILGSVDDALMNINAVLQRRRNINSERAVTCDPESALGNLIQWAIGNRGGKDGNPYCVPEVREALKTLAQAKGWTEAQIKRGYYDAADEYRVAVTYTCAVCGKTGPEHGHYDATDPNTHKFVCGKPVKP